MRLPAVAKPMRPRLTGLLVALVACGGRDPAVAVTLGPDHPPTYRWSGGAAFALSVVRVDAPAEVVWGVAAGGSPVASPVRQGTVPTDGVATATGEPALAPGTRYRVSVTLADGRTGHREFVLPAAVRRPVPQETP